MGGVALSDSELLVHRPTDPDELRRYERTIGDPGSYPYTRGTRAPRPPDPSASAAADGGTITRELSGEGPAGRSNEQFHNLIAHGATGLDVIGDTPTMAYLDPDHPAARHAVGNQGVSLCRAEDWIELYDGIPLGPVSVSHSLPAAFAIAGLYIAANAHGIEPATVRGSALQAPIYAEDTGYAARLPYDLRMRLALDSMEFAAERMPRFHSFVEDTYYISDGGIDIVDEMALGFVEIREITRRLIARGLDVDRFAPRIGLLVNCGMRMLDEVAKIRASRRLFARMMRNEFGARDPRSMAVNIAAHTSGATMTAQQLPNNIVRGAVQALALMLAGVRAMEISAFDEALRTPSHEAHMVGLRTQQVIQLETGVTDVSDPLGGSWYLERLTDDLEEQINERIRDIEEQGEIRELCEHGFFRSLFADAMVDRADEVRDGTRPVVGVNLHRIPDEDDTMLRDLSERRIAPSWEQIDRIQAWKERRDRGRVSRALDALHDAVADEGVNLMPLFVEALVADATLGECTGVMRLAYGAPYDPVAGQERPL